MIGATPDGRDWPCAMFGANGHAESRRVFTGFAGGATVRSAEYFYTSQRHGVAFSVFGALYGLPVELKH